MNAEDKQDGTISKKAKVAFIVLLILIGIGLLGVVIFTLPCDISPSSSDCCRLNDLSIGLLVAGASLCFGGIFGFLFGMPRTGDNAAGQSSQLLSQLAPNGNHPQNQNVAQPQPKTKPNTNLEEISDWLTKILVGAGLTQLTKLPGKLGEFNDYVAKGMSCGEAAKAFTGVSVVFFGICGFLAVFLWTRLYMAELLGDGAIVGELIKKDEAQQEKIDATERNLRKILTERIVGKAMADPMISEQQQLVEDKAEVDVAAGYVRSQDPKSLTPTDLLVLAYDAYRKRDYKAAIAMGERALALNPPAEMLWRIHNFLGLCYHYSEPATWKPGDNDEWMTNAIKHFEAALGSGITTEEKLLAKANLTFVYLDCGRYDDAIKAATDIISADVPEGDRIRSIKDLANISLAVAKAMKGDDQGATAALNSINNLSDFSYLFNPEDLPSAALKFFKGLAELKPSVKEFLARA